MVRVFEIDSRLYWIKINIFFYQNHKVPEKFEKKSITYEFSDDAKDNSEYKNFDSSAFLANICKNAKAEGLSNEHASDFKKLSNSLESKSADELVALYENAKSKCDLARV